MIYKQQYLETPPWRPEFWFHEDIHFVSLPKYMQMEGFRFPGSPRR